MLCKSDKPSIIIIIIRSDAQVGDTYWIPYHQPISPIFIINTVVLLGARVTLLLLLSVLLGNNRLLPGLLPVIVTVYIQLMVMK